METIKFDNVIIKYTDDSWYNRPTNWYDIQNKLKNDEIKKILPFLKSRGYIAIKKIFSEVKISRKKRN